MKKKQNKNLLCSNIIKNTSGSILPQLIVAAAVIGGISTAVMNYTKNAQKSTRYEAENITKKDLISNFQDIFRSKSACSTTFSGENPSAPINLAQVSNGTSTVINLNGTNRSTKVFGNIGTQGTISIMSMATQDFETHGPAYQLKDNTGALTGSWQRVGKFFLKVSFKRGIHYNNTGGLIAKSDQETTKLSVSSVNQYKLIPIIATYQSNAGGSSGNIVNCIAMDDEGKSYKELGDDGVGSLNSGLSEYCSILFEGNAEQDGQCRHITVSDGPTDYAAKIGGRVIIQQSNFSTGDNLDVAGSVGVGQAIGVGQGLDGRLSMSNSLSVGTITPPADDGDAHFQNSVGIGVAPSSMLGSVKVNASAAIGPSFNPIGDGNLAVQGALRVGPGANTSTSAPGTLQVEQNLGIGTIPSRFQSGFVHANRSVTVGNVSEEGNGNLTVQGYINVPNQSLTVSNGDHAATQSWVATKVGNTLDPNSVGAAANIMTDIMAANPDETGFSAFCRGTRTKNIIGPVPASSFLSGMCNMISEYCSKDGECPTVFAEGGGVNSAGNITSGSGWLRATKANALIRANTGTMSAPDVRARTSLCLRGVCKTSWSAITPSHGACQNRSSNQSCSSGYFVRRVTLNKSNWNYPTSFTTSGAWGVNRNTQTRSVVDSITVQCCKVNQN